MMVDVYIRVGGRLAILIVLDISEQKSKGHSFLLHRLVWLYFNDTIPDMLDHINRDRYDNRIENLRGAPSRAFNTVNSVPRSDNTSGYKGVTWHKNVGKWHCSIFKDGKRHYIGIFNDPKEAAKKYNEMAVELFGNFAHLNEV